MTTNPLVPAFYYYKFAQAISSPYTSFDAFHSGTIDANGNILKPESSIDPFEYFVIKLKKIFEQLPPGMTKASLSSYIPALQMFSEEIEQYGVDYYEMELFLEGYIASNTDGELSYIGLCEDMASGNLGGPASTTNAGGVAGYDPPMQTGVMKRKSILGFEDSCDMFDVCPDDYKMFVGAKKWRHVPESESKRYIYRRLGRTGKKVAIRNSETGEIHFPMFEAHKPIDGYFASKILNFLNEDVHTTKQGQHAGHVLERLINQVGKQEHYDLSNLSPDQTEYVGRMVDWVNGFHAASTSGEPGHAEQWIDLGLRNAEKKSSRNDSAGANADPDGFRYDPTAKSKNFEDRVIKVDYGTDRKPVGELSRKRPGIELQGETIPLPTEKSEFKKTVRELIQDPDTESRMRREMESGINIPQTIGHRTFTDTRKPLRARGFITHPIEQLKQLIQSRMFNISPAIGSKTENEPQGRQTVKSLDLRVRSRSSPSTERGMGYDEIRSIPGGDAPKEALSVSTDALDHLFDQIPDTFVGQNGMHKDTLRQHAAKIIAPHMEKGRYPLELPSSKVIST